MKNTSQLLTIMILLAVLLTSAIKPPEKISLGSALPHSQVSMNDISGDRYTLNEIKKKNGLLLVFAANKCIAIKYWGDRLLSLAQYAEKNNIGVVWVNSNQTQRNEGESLQDMQSFARSKAIEFPYVIDNDFLLANTFGVEVTPTSYLFDANSKLVYQGLVDNNMADATAVTENYLKDALVALVNEENITRKEIFGRGCRIPRE